MNSSVVIIGASGHGKVIADIIQKSGDVVKGFLDDSENIPNILVDDLPVLGRVKDYKQYLDYKFVIAIGNGKIRKKIVDSLEGVLWYTAIHPTAVISGIDVCIGEGTVVMANAVINSSVQIGKHCIVNTGAIVEHDNKISDFVHVSVGARLAGTVNVGENTWIGIGSSVSNNVSICADCIVGAGTVIVKDIMYPGTYVGVPSRKI